VERSLNNGNPLPSGVNVVKATAYWYDPRHQNGWPYANIDLELYDEDIQAPIQISDSPSDNKERVFFAGNLGGRRLSLRIKGTTVYASHGCANGIRVYYSYFYESSNRGSDADGLPTWNSTTGIGVQPEN
jgi:hypothetical protein